VNPRKIYKITNTLVISQLRSGRSGAKFVTKPILVLLVDIAVFVGAASLVALILWAIGTMPPDFANTVNTLTRQAVVSIPAFVAPVVFITAVLFELSVSSKFASSDAINWLPVSQTDYVTASALSVSYMYSWLPALALGTTYPLAARIGLQSVWGAAAVLTLVSLFGIGALVEIMRAAINRVSSMVYGKAGRGTIVIRLAVVVVVILAVEMLVNPVILSGLIGSFTGAVNTAFFFPFFWPSVSVTYLIGGQVLASAVFFVLSVFFALSMLVVAVAVRSRYWSPLPVTINVTESVYAPRTGVLQSLGLSAIEAAIVRKDLKGYTRRRELISYLAIPIVFVALGVITQLSAPSSGSTPLTSYWLLGGIMALIAATSSIGQEGKAIWNVYAAPVTARAFLRAKLIVASIFGWMTVVGLVVASSILSSASLSSFVASLAISVMIAVECTMIGVGLATRFPDLVERPRPRFIRPKGLVVAIVLGLSLALLTALPLLLWPFMGAYLEGVGLSYGLAVGIVLVFGGVVSVVAYRWAISGASRLMAELPI
jgi:hypothetical protein